MLFHTSKCVLICYSSHRKLILFHIVLWFYYIICVTVSPTVAWIYIYIYISLTSFLVNRLSLTHFFFSRASNGIRILLHCIKSSVLSEWPRCAQHNLKCSGAVNWVLHKYLDTHSFQAHEIIPLCVLEVQCGHVICFAQELWANASSLSLFTLTCNLVMCEIEVVWQLASLSDSEVQCLPETKVRNKCVFLAPEISRWLPLHDLVSFCLSDSYNLWRELRHTHQ